jgi:hypothetical protein
MLVRSSYLIGPALAMAAVGVLALILRWIYRDAAPPPTPRTGPTDFGLLVPVTTVPDSAAAAGLRGLLGQHGIRTTLAPGPAGGLIVLVFAADEPRARALLTPSE